MNMAKDTLVANTDANKFKMQSVKFYGGDRIMKKDILYSVLDGLSQGVILCLFSDYFFSVYFIEPVEYNFVFSMILTLFSLTSFVFLVLYKAKETVRVKVAVSIVSFLVVMFIEFINLIFFNVRVLPLRETSDVDGLLIVFFVIPYFVASIVLRAIALIINVIKEKR